MSNEKILIMIIYSIICFFVIETNWGTSTIFINNNWWATIYSSNWSTSYISNNGLGRYSIYTSPNPNTAYQNVINNKLEDLKEMNQKIEEYSQSNKENTKVLDSNYSKNINDLLNSIEKLCETSKNLWTYSCQTMVDAWETALNKWISGNFLSESCEYQSTQGLVKLEKIKQKYWLSVTNNLLKVNQCPLNSSKITDSWFNYNLYVFGHPLNNWSCYCNDWYTNNQWNDLCIQEVDKNFCTKTYWENIKNSKDINWNIICACNDGFYFDEDKNICISIEKKCSETVWENSKWLLKDGVYSCGCIDGYNIGSNWKCSYNTWLVNAISWLYNNWLTMYWIPSTFLPNDYITREQASKFFVLFSKQILKKAVDKKIPVSLIDLNRVDKTLQSHVKEAYQLWLFKWVKGVFSPFNNLTRAQAIAVLMRSINGLEEKKWQDRYEYYYNRANTYKLLDWLDFDYTTLDLINITRWEVAILLYKLNNSLK